jgi:hypothetical protein
MAAATPVLPNIKFCYSNGTSSGSDSDGSSPNEYTVLVKGPKQLNNTLLFYAELGFSFLFETHSKSPLLLFHNSKPIVSRITVQEFIELVGTAAPQIVVEVRQQEAGDDDTALSHRTTGIETSMASLRVGDGADGDITTRDDMSMKDVEHHGRCLTLPPQRWHLERNLPPS